jgi:hypothetical protein
MNDIFENQKEQRDWWRGETAVYRKEMDDLLVSLCELILRGFINLSALNSILSTNRGSLTGYERAAHSIPGLISRVRNAVLDCTFNVSQQIRSTLEGFNFENNCKFKQEISQVFENMDLSSIDPTFKFLNYQAALSFSLKTFSDAISTVIDYDFHTPAFSKAFTSKTQELGKGSPAPVNGPFKRGPRNEDLMSSLLLDSYIEEAGKNRRDSQVIFC